MNRIFFVLSLLATIFCGVVKADDWSPPPARIFSSSEGTMAIKIIPIDFDESTGTVFRLNRDGSEEVVWSQKLVNAPLSVYIWRGNGPGHPMRVVTLDTWANAGYKHALVVYDEKGQVILDAKLEDLLTPEEIDKNVWNSVSSRWWRSDATTDFDGDGEHSKFIIKLSWGKVLSVNLKSGAIQSAATASK